MDAPSRDGRILGLGVGAFETRNAPLFRSLERRYDVVGMLRPELPKLEDYLIKLRYIQADRDGWRARAVLNTRTFDRLTAILDRQLVDWEGRYDLILQLQTLFAPGRDRRWQPYVVYTDNTYSLTERNYPAWAPLSRGQSRKWKQREQVTCRDARFVFTWSDLARSSVIDDYGCDPARVIAVGAGTNSFVPTLGGKGYDSRIALFVGIDFERKGGPLLLRAWERVRQRLPGAELWIIGPKRGDPKLPSEAGVRWLGHVSDRQVLADAYDRAAVFVLPSNYDPYPHVLREAMGHGLPCVGTAAGGIPEIIQDGETGLVVPPGEPAPLSEALLGLLGDPQRAEAMGRRGHDDVLRNHTWDRVVDRMAPSLELAISAAR